MLSGMALSKGGIAMTSDSSTQVTQPDLRALRLGMSDTFSTDELKVACFDLGIKYDSLPGEGLETKVVELIGYAQRRGRLQDLVAYVQQERPNLKLSPKIQTVTTTPGALEEQRAQHRYALRNGRRDIYLVHTLRPSPGRAGWYDILIYLVAHKDADLSTVSYAEFFLGKYWGNRIYKATNDEGFVGIGTKAYGPVLCTCRIVFQDDHEVLLDRYIDLEMADSLSRTGETRVGRRVRYRAPLGPHGGS
jgi:Effector-associated domain 7/prokaryotic YEATS domain